MMRQRVGIIVVIAVSAGALIGGALWWHYRQQRVQLITLKNIVVGHLDNVEYLKAAPLLQQIVQQLPEDPLGHRNLTIALNARNDVSYKSMNKDLFGSTNPKRIPELFGAVDGMLRVEPASFASQYLAGIVYKDYAEEVQSNPQEFNQSLARSREHFQKAAGLSKSDPAPLFQLYDLEHSYGNPDAPTDDALDHLQRALRRAPNNLWLHADLITVFAARQQPELRNTVAQTLRLFPPGSDPKVSAALREVDGLLAQASPEALRRGYEQASASANLLRANSLARDDRRQLDPHPLAFMLTDFGDQVTRSLPPEVAAPPVPVQFISVPHGPANFGPIAAMARDDLTDKSEYGTVLLRPGNGSTRVEVVAAPANASYPPLDVPGTFDGLALVDLDWDASQRPSGATSIAIPPDLDLVLYGPSGVRVLENREENGQRRWVDRTSEARIPPFKDVRWLLAHDIDHDGNIDLVVGLENGIRILRNRGESEFDDITSRSSGLDGLETIAAVAADFDRDGDLDILCLSKTGKLILLDNQRGGRFEAQGQPGDYPRATALLAFDVNNDGRVDLLIGHATGATLLLAGPNGVLSNASQKIDLAAKATVKQMGFFDYDNDGWMDLWLLTDDSHNPLRLYRNIQGERLEDATKLLPVLEGPISAVVANDIDNDGDLDLIVAGPKGIQTLRNDGGNRNAWLNLRLRAQVIKDAPGTGQAAKVNYFNIGGTIEIKSGLRYQWQQVAGTVTHFGLGQRKQVDVARMIWTNGVPQAEIRPTPNQTLVAIQAPKGSCPFLFAWNGQRFDLVTDCLWSSALGMKLAPDVYMDHRRQENYLIIPDDKLQPRDGEYVLQFTNELWEVPYLDQAELWVVEHPGDVEVFTNQRIGPNPEKEFRFRTVSTRRYPLAAKDHRGRDVSGMLNQNVGCYVGGFWRRRYVGQAEPHWLELDLGNLIQAKQVTLYLTGWIWPTDTSANVAIAQDPRFQTAESSLGGAQPPALLIPDGRGSWTTAIANMGFPSGKMQTVAVDLPLTKFPKGDYRVRIATALELYWSDAFFTVDEPTVDLQVARLPVASADLHYRGFSQIYQTTPSSPFLFDYNDVDPSPCWLPIRGPYTRYGNVTELLRQPDSRYVAMNVGDELTLRFKAAPSAAPGRRHTYLFHANGWLKDFDMNGGASDQTGPLPFDGMSKYPYGPPENYPETSEGHSFLRTYMTRDSDARTFWDLLRPKPTRSK